jgi:hypothetical protein
LPRASVRGNDQVAGSGHQAEVGDMQRLISQ